MAAAVVSMALKGTSTPTSYAQTKECGNIIDKVKLPNKSSVLIVGGTGAVGRNTASALLELCPDLHIIIGGRNRDKGVRIASTLGKNSEFAQVDTGDIKSLQAAMTGVDLVVHAAGPFVHLDCNVLEVAIQSKTAYIDVCDTAIYARRAKSLKTKAMAAGVPAISTAGISPGLSNMIAAKLVHAAETESRGPPERLRFYYYTAGCGGAGPAMLATSFCLFGEEAVAYSKGVKMKFSPYSKMLNIDFGKGIGKKEVFLLNLPEVRSTHEILGVPTVSARFGSEPFFWNWGISAMTRLMPNELLRDKDRVQSLVQKFYPFVRAVDVISGETFSMRVDLECSDGSNISGVFTHKRLSEAVGAATAAFVVAVLEGSTKPGVWFPEEPEGIAVEARELLLRRAARGTINFAINKSF